MPGPLPDRLESLEDGDVGLAVGGVRPHPISRPPSLPQARPFKNHVFAVRIESPNGRPPAFRCERTILPDRRVISALMNGRNGPRQRRGFRRRSTTTSRRWIGLSPSSRSRARISADSMPRPGRPGGVVDRHHEDAPSTRRGRRWAPRSPPTTSSQRVKTTSMDLGSAARRAVRAAAASSSPTRRGPPSARAVPHRSPGRSTWTGPAATSIPAGSGAAVVSRTGRPAARPPGPCCAPGRARRRRRRGAASDQVGPGRGRARGPRGAAPGPGSAARPGRRGCGPRGPRGPGAGRRGAARRCSPPAAGRRSGWPRARRAGRPSQDRW